MGNLNCDDYLEEQAQAACVVQTCVRACAWEATIRGTHLGRTVMAQVKG